MVWVQDIGTRYRLCDIPAKHLSAQHLKTSSYSCVLFVRLLRTDYKIMSDKSQHLYSDIL